MNWLQKLSKIIETKHIPYQIYSSLRNISEKEWKFYAREKGYRNWSAGNPDKASFSANYTLELPTATISGWDQQLSYKLVVFWEMPFDSGQYDSGKGLEDMGFWAALWKYTKKETPQGWLSAEPEELWSPMLSTPFELAKWVDSEIQGSHFGFDDPSPNDDNPDMFPEWPYSEDDYTGVETDEEMANLRGGRIRGNRMI